MTNKLRITITPRELQAMHVLLSRAHSKTFFDFIISDTPNHHLFRQVQILQKMLDRNGIGNFDILDT